MHPAIEKVLKQPPKQKIALLVLVVAAIAAAMYFLMYAPKQKEYKELRIKLEKLQAQVDESRKLAANLPQFRVEYKQLSEELAKALTELPNQKEIPTLLTSITNNGKTAGVDFLLFRPKGEEKKDFYAAVPVDITITGSFFSIGRFFASVAMMPRIVNLTNISFADIRDVGGRTSMRVVCLATTFRFLSEAEKDKGPKKEAKK